MIFSVFKTNTYYHFAYLVLQFHTVTSRVTKVYTRKTHFKLLLMHIATICTRKVVFIDIVCNGFCYNLSLESNIDETE